MPFGRHLHHQRTEPELARHAISHEAPLAAHAERRFQDIDTIEDVFTES